MSVNDQGVNLQIRISLHVLGLLSMLCRPPTIFSVIQAHLNSVKIKSDCI
jgi:hypothetical protein